jgi:lysozyme family protein
MRDTFDAWFKQALKYEGTKFEDVPGDRGGPTKFGITIYRLAEVRKVKLGKRGSASWIDMTQEVRALGQDEAREIYDTYYWQPVRGDDLPAGLDFAVADFGLNSGPSRAVKKLQALIGARQDGVFGPKTLDALQAYGDISGLIERYCDTRREFLNAIVENSPNQAKFLNGWMNRVKQVQAKSAALAAQHVPNIPPPVPIEAMPKAVADIDARETATVADLRPLSSKLTLLQRAKVAIGAFFAWIISMVGAAFTPDNYGFVKEVAGDMSSFVQANTLVMMGGFAVAVVGLIAYLERRTLTDYKEGRYDPSGT